MNLQSLPISCNRALYGIDGPRHFRLKSLALIVAADGLSSVCSRCYGLLVLHFLSWLILPMLDRQGRSQKRHGKRGPSGGWAAWAFCFLRRLFSSQSKISWSSCFLTPDRTAARHAGRFCARASQFQWSMFVCFMVSLHTSLYLSFGLPWGRGAFFSSPNSSCFGILLSSILLT